MSLIRKYEIFNDNLIIELTQECSSLSMQVLFRTEPERLYNLVKTKKIKQEFSSNEKHVLVKLHKCSSFIILITKFNKAKVDFAMEIIPNTNIRTVRNDDDMSLDNVPQDIKDTFPNSNNSQEFETDDGFENIKKIVSMMSGVDINASDEEQRSAMNRIGGLANMFSGLGNK